MGRQRWRKKYASLILRRPADTSAWICPQPPTVAFTQAAPSAPPLRLFPQTSPQSAPQSMPWPIPLPARSDPFVEPQQQHLPTYRAPPPPPPGLWDTDACARPVPSGTEQKCKAKVKEKGSSVTCHRRLSLQWRQTQGVRSGSTAPKSYELHPGCIMHHASPAPLPLCLQSSTSFQPQPAQPRRASPTQAFILSPIDPPHLPPSTNPKSLPLPAIVRRPNPPPLRQGVAATGARLGGSRKSSDMRETPCRPKLKRGWGGGG